MTSLSKSKTNFEMIFNVFEPLVWIFCFISLIFNIIIIRMLSNLIPVLRKMSLSWSTVSTLLNQPITHKLPQNISTRILIFFWIFACFVLTKSYSQCLYSLMAVPLKTKTIDTIQELADALKDDSISVRTDKSTGAYELIKVISSFIYNIDLQILLEYKHHI